MPGGKKTVPMEDSDVQEVDPVQVLREHLPPPKCGTTNTDRAAQHGGDGGDHTP